MNLTRTQWLGIMIVIFGTLAISSAQLSDVFGSGNAKIVVSLSAIINTMLGGVVTLLGGQGTQIKDVLAMAGVEKVTVNSSANSTLAAIAVNPAIDKIAPLTADVDTVTATAKGNT